MRKNPTVMILVGYEKKQCGYFFTFCINHIQISPATIKVQLCSAINSIALLMLMLHSLWRHLVACFIIFLKVCSSFGGHELKAAGAPPHPKTPAIATTIVYMVIKRADIDTIVITCHEIRYKVFSPKRHLYQKHFQWPIWSLQPTLEGLFSFITVFRALLVVQSSSLPEYLYIAVLVLQNK